MTYDAMANYGYVITDLAWLDELKLKDWPAIKHLSDVHPYEFDDLLIQEDNIEHLCLGELLDCDTPPCVMLDEDFDGDEEAVAKNVATAYVEHWQALQTEFAEKTGLMLYAIRYDSEGGSAYDDLTDGINFMVSNVTQLTEAAKREIDAKHIEKVFWTVFG